MRLHHDHQFPSPVPQYTVAGAVGSKTIGATVSGWQRSRFSEPSCHLGRSSPRRRRSPRRTATCAGLDGLPRLRRRARYIHAARSISLAVRNGPRSERPPLRPRTGRNAGGDGLRSGLCRACLFLSRLPVLLCDGLRGACGSPAASASANSAETGRSRRNSSRCSSGTAAFTISRAMPASLCLLKAEEDVIELFRPGGCFERWADVVVVRRGASAESAGFQDRWDLP